MSEERECGSRADILTVLNVLAGTGLNSRRAADLARELEVSPTTMSRWLKRLAEAGWARELEDGWVIGEAAEFSIRRIEEDKAATAKLLAEIGSGSKPPPPDEPEDVFTIIRFVHDMRKDFNELRRELRGKVDSLRDETKGQNQGKAVV